MQIFRILNAPVALLSSRNISKTRLLGMWVKNVGLVPQDDACETFTIMGPHGMATVVVSVEVVYDGLVVSVIGSDVEDAYYRLFDSSSYQAYTQRGSASPTDSSSALNTLDPAARLELASDSCAFPNASGIQETSTSNDGPRTDHQDVTGNAILYDNAPGEGCTQDVHADDIMDVDFSTAVLQLNGMVFGHRSRGSWPSIFDLDVESLHIELFSHGIDFSCLCDEAVFKLDASVSSQMLTETGFLKHV
ncbi:hypothetical protein EDD18DRAFT_1356245 [Armillaria luteobubalina]|uniref:Uncharacterized protein n=1 Tax=Armillaria luteobubalina TaxID=153913 RepID=A0AA39Q182_9AGAR|nr:hypothetical protein EDD18DRAFT_1356245 [Armillaria luteobubalina]